MKKDIVYFDGNCSLCKKEIALWQKLSSDQFEFKDLHQQTLSAQRQKEMLTFLHLEKQDGSTLVGIDANFRLWRSHPIGWASYILSIPGIYQLTRAIYNRWAYRRYDKKYNCDICQS